jgi:hypothetical protein
MADGSSFDRFEGSESCTAPAKDTIVSQAAGNRHGIRFGLQKAMDQLGATIGPVFFSVLFALNGAADKGIGEYQRGYLYMLVPFVLMMCFLVYAFIKVPDPQKLEAPAVNPKEPEKLNRVFWLYSVFTFITTPDS